MTWPPLEPTHLSRPPALGSSGDTKSLGPLLVEIPAHVQNEVVIAAATETPRGELSHAAGAHVAEGHGADYLTKSLARNTTGRSAWAFSSKNLRDARSSIISRSRIN
jgi:hypothetical protein